jgi:RNA polymerase sigma-70 factor (ECF subfamily)
LPSFQARASARTWLLSIARRTCVDHIRTVARNRRLLARLATAEPGQDNDHIDLAAHLAAAQLLSRLGTDQREAFVLTQVLGLSYADAAKSLDVPIGTIRSRVARARSELLAQVRRTLTA